MAQKDIRTIGKGFKSLNEDVNAARKKKSARIITVATIIIVALNLFVIWWWPHSAEFGKSGAFKEEEVKKQAEKVIGLLEQDDYDSLSAMADKTMQNAFSEENRSQWETSKQAIGEDWGEFVSFGETNMTELKQMGRLYATVRMEVKYQNVSVTYSMSFDVDMKLAGFYLQ